MLLFRIPVILVFVCLIAAGPIHGADDLITVQSEDAAAGEQIRDLAAGAEKSIRFLVRGAAPRVPIRFIAGPGRRELQDDKRGCVFPLDTSRPERVIQAEIVRALLYRWALEHRSVKQVKPRHIPDWLVAAIQYRAAMGAGNPLPDDWYRASRVLVRKRRAPKLTELVDQPLPPTEPLLYELYADVSACALQVLLRADPMIVGKLLKTTQPLLTPSRNLGALLKPGKHPLDAWFQERFPKVTRTPGTRSAAAAVAQSVAALERISVPVPDSDKKMVVRLDQVADLDPAYRIPARELEQRLEQLYRLQYYAPLLLTEPLRTYIKALFEYQRNGKTDRFVRDLKAAREALGKAVKRIADIQSCLRRLERGKHSPARRVYGFYPLIEAGLDETDFETAVDLYLKRLELRLQQKAP